MPAAAVHCLVKCCAGGPDAATAYVLAKNAAATGGGNNGTAGTAGGRAGRQPEDGYEDELKRL